LSFRNRLTLFFVVIVVVPMIAVSLVLFRVVADSERGKTDARLGQAQRAASGLYREFQRRAGDAAEGVGSDAELADAIRSEERPRIESRLALLANRRALSRVRLTMPGVAQIDLGPSTAVAANRTRLLGDRGREVGELVVSVITADDYVRLVNRTTGLDVVVSEEGRLMASSLTDTSSEPVPLRGKIGIGSVEYSTAGFDAPAFGDPQAQTSVRLLADERDTEDAVSSSSLYVAAALIGFLVVAFAFALTVSRSLQAQVQRLLDAARRLGKGDFHVQVPTEGTDEFSALGQEFNAMARQLEGRLDELNSERGRLQEAIRRVGESFAKGLDREALLGILVQTAVDGVGAQCGRAAVRVRGGAFKEVASVGDLTACELAMNAAESAAVESNQASETHVGPATAIAHPLHADADEESGPVLGVISVARPEGAFSPGERDLFAYLATQGAVSIENVDLHETVARQAVTDELTGLFNHRRFQEVMATEVERAKRFGHELGLIMLDIDDFKRVNDSYGHRQGDLVLREVARILRESSREIDEPARYGGEEMAIALPQTDLDGAYLFAERLRRRIEELRVPILDGDGSISVTASLGAAALSGSAEFDKDDLVAAADAALYAAKRAGKNRTMRADGTVARRPR
jgi:diguanylate cyclase (GGDEF)-like protein